MFIFEREREGGREGERTSRGGRERERERDRETETERGRQRIQSGLCTVTLGAQTYKP